MKDIIVDNLFTRWIARIILIIFIIYVIWWFFSKVKKYKYNGITKYKKNFFDLFVFKKKKRTLNKTEELCRNILQKIYNKPFPSVRPKFLRNPLTNKNLELDCYNEELKIALEYNGQQHYSYTPYFHKTKNNFYSQVHRDDWKRNKCKELGIKLIEVPYWVSKLDLEDYITKQLKKKGCL
jgi:hypothetical protein